MCMGQLLTWGINVLHRPFSRGGGGGVKGCLSVTDLYNRKVFFSILLWSYEEIWPFYYYYFIILLS